MYSIMIKLTPSARETIWANSYQSPKEIAQILLQEHDLVVSQGTIRQIIKKKESTSEETKALVLAEIEENISQFVDEKTKEYLISLDDNIKNIEERMYAPGTTDENFIKFSKLLSDQVKAMLSIKQTNSFGSSLPKSNVNVTIDFDKMVETLADYRSKEKNNTKEIECGDYQLL